MGIGDDRNLMHQASAHPELVNTTDEEGDTVLIIASKYCEPQSVELLIKKGADVKATGQLGRNCLHWAAWIGNDKNLVFLANKYPELVNSKDKYGDSVLTLAR